MKYLQARKEPILNEAVEPESWFYWQAYHHLSESRTSGLTVGAIPFSEISNYSDWLGITCPVEQSNLVRVVMALDGVERSLNGESTASD